MIDYREKLFFILVFTCSLSCVLSADTTIWHHAASPYRAIFSVTASPLQPRCGVVLEVPTSGLSDEREGYDLFAFDAMGQSLSLQTLGPGLRNNTMVVVREPEPKSLIYLYFGSGALAPQNRTFFRPSLRSSIYSFSQEVGTANWRQAQAGLAVAEQIGLFFAENISMGTNPVDSRSRYAVDISGYFMVEEEADYRFFLVSENAGYLLINDNLLIERSGRPTAASARRGEYNRQIRLTRGIHSIRCVVFNSGGRMAAMVGRFIDDRQFRILPGDFFLHSGTSEMQAVQSRTQQRHPLFDYQIIAYIGYEDVYYHLVRLSTVFGDTAEWRFDNGLRGQGARVNFIIPGSSTRLFQVRHDGRQLQGAIHFPERAPPRRLISNSRHFTNFISIMQATPITELSTAPLLAYYRFVKYDQGHAWLTKLAAELIERPDLAPEKKRQAIIDLARIGSVEIAEDAYRQLMRNLPDDQESRLAHLREVHDFLLYRMAAPEQAQLILSQLRRVDSSESKLVELLMIDQALAVGESQAANRIFQKLTGTPRALREQHQAQTRGNFLERKFYAHLAQEELSLAWEVLRDWEVVSPYHRQTGSFQLARSRLFSGFGWHEAAFRILEQAVLFNPRLSYLPEIELEKWRLMQALDRHDEAESLKKKIIEEYPNHPMIEQLRSG